MVLTPSLYTRTGFQLAEPADFVVEVQIPVYSPV